MLINSERTVLALKYTEADPRGSMVGIYGTVLTPAVGVNKVSPEKRSTGVFWIRPGEFRAGLAFFGLRPAP